MLEGGRAAGWASQESNVGHVEFEMSFGHSNGDVRWTGGVRKNLGLKI